MASWRWTIGIIWLAGCHLHHHNTSQLEQADILYNQQNYSQALPFYEADRQENGDSLETLLKEADCLKHTCQFEQAEIILNKALVCDENAKAQKLLAEFYLDRRQGDKAQTQYEDLCSKHPDDALLMNRFGVAFDMQGFHNKAQEMYRKALEVAPMDVNYQGNYSLSLAYSGKYDEAITILKPLIHDTKQRHNLAIVYALMQRTDDFHELLKSDLTTQERKQLLDQLNASLQEKKP